MHLAIWSPVTWLHTAQIEDDYLFFSTVRSVCTDTQQDFAQLVDYFVQRDKEQMDFMLGEKKRIFMLNEFENQFVQRAPDQEAYS